MRETGNHGKKWIVLPTALLTAAAAGVILALLEVGGVSVSPQRLYDKMVFPLFRLLLYLAVGLMVGQAVESLGWTTRLARWARPLTRWGRLKEESGASFIAGFVSGIVANTLLSNFYRSGVLSRREMVLTYLVNNGLPIFLVHLPTTFFIVISLAGKAGLVYVCITFVAACMRSFGALLYSRLTLPVPAPGTGASQVQPREGTATSVRSAFTKYRERFLRLLLYTFPIYVLIFLANEGGLFQWLRTKTTHLISAEFFPIEAAGVVIFSLAAEFSSGMAAAGALIDAGALTVKQAAVALIAGTVLSTPIRAVRHQLPTHAGIFPLALATELLFLGQGLRILSLIVVTSAYVLWAQ